MTGTEIFWIVMMCYVASIPAFIVMLVATGLALSLLDTKMADSALFFLFAVALIIYAPFFMAVASVTGYAQFWKDLLR